MIAPAETPTPRRHKVSKTIYGKSVVEGYDVPAKLWQEAALLHEGRYCMHRARAAGTWLWHCTQEMSVARGKPCPPNTYVMYGGFVSSLCPFLHNCSSTRHLPSAP